MINKRNTLALLGGEPVINKAFRPYNTFDNQESYAVNEVIQNGVLSGYIAAVGSHFMGGPKVRDFEKKIANYFGVKHALAVNSWTSGLISAVGAIGIEPGDEIITTPWTMAATATAILHWNAIPVFSDIDDDTFNIAPSAIEKLITSKTKAIITVDIFGQSVAMDEIQLIANRYNLKIISDTAQSPGATLNGRFAGTMADIGGLSFNYHKHIHCGEGGVLFTDSDTLAERLSMIRNHAEAVIRPKKSSELCNMLGYNFRMGEIEAAIATVQLDKLSSAIRSRQLAAEQLNKGLTHLPGLTVPKVSKGATHVYYMYGMKINVDELGVTRDYIVKALKAEGVPGIILGYQNIHRLPIFQQKIAYGTNHFPWHMDGYSNDINYRQGICPIAETLHDKTFIGLNMCMYDFSEYEVSKIIESFNKVWSYLI